MNPGQIIHAGRTHLRVIHSGPEVTRLKDTGTGAVVFIYPDGSVNVAGELTDLTLDLFNAIKVAYQTAYK